MGGVFAFGRGWWVAWSEVQDVRIRRGGLGHPEFWLRLPDGRERAVDFDLTGVAGAPLMQMLLSRLQPLLDRKRARFRDTPHELLCGASRTQVGLGAALTLPLCLVMVWVVLGPMQTMPTAAGRRDPLSAALPQICVALSLMVAASTLVGLLRPEKLLVLGATEVGWRQGRRERLLDWPAVQRVMLQRMSYHGATIETLTIRGEGLRLDLPGRMFDYLFALEVVRARAINATVEDHSGAPVGELWGRLLGEALHAQADVPADEPRRRQPSSALLLVGLLSLQGALVLLAISTPPKRLVGQGTAALARVTLVTICQCGKPELSYEYPTPQGPRRGYFHGQTPRPTWQRGDTFAIAYDPQHPERSRPAWVAPAEPNRRARLAAACLALLGGPLLAVGICGAKQRLREQRLRFGPPGAG